MFFVICILCEIEFINAFNTDFVIGLGCFYLRVRRTISTMNSELNMINLNWETTMNLYKNMNTYLANQQVMYIKLHNLHWYLQGKSFFTLHAKFEELYDQTAVIIDEVAERMLALDQKPVASLKKALGLSKVKELDDEFVSSEAAIQHLLVDVEYWVRDTAEIANLADEAGDAITADMFNGYLKEYQQLHWMLKSYLAG